MDWEAVLADLHRAHGHDVLIHPTRELWMPRHCNRDVALRLEVARIILKVNRHLKHGQQLTALLARDSKPRAAMITPTVLWEFLHQQSVRLPGSLQPPQIVLDYLAAYERFYAAIPP